MIYTPTTEDIDDMNRTDLIFELAKYARPEQYHRLMKMPTLYIKRLVKFYTQPEPKYTHTFTVNGVAGFPNIGSECYLLYSLLF